MIALLASLSMSPGASALEILGKVRPITVVAFGRNNEPARGRIVITNDEKWAFGGSPWPYQESKYLFRWPVDRPSEYKMFRVSWRSNGKFRTVVPSTTGKVSGTLSSRGFLIAALSSETVLLGADTELFPPGAFRWEIVALSPFGSRVRKIASGGDLNRAPAMLGLVYDSQGGWLKTNVGFFRVSGGQTRPAEPRFSVERRPNSHQGPYFEVDGKTGSAVEIDDRNANLPSFKYWGNALFRSSRDGSGHDYWDRSRKAWVRLGYSITGESADRTKLVFADYSPSSKSRGATFIVTLRKELR